MSSPAPAAAPAAPAPKKSYCCGKKPLGVCCKTAALGLAGVGVAALAGFGIYKFLNRVTYTKTKLVLPPSDGHAEGYGCMQHKGEVVRVPFDLHKLEDDFVEFAITYSGVCHSDIHTIDGDWGNKEMPLIAGHEMLGYVTAMGKNVKGLSIGQRVGAGPQVLSCMRPDCTMCSQHHEINCPNVWIGAYGDKMADGHITKGGYATYCRVHQHFVIPVPDGLPSAEAAPLLCAGVTTFTPLKDAKVGPGMKVGIIGIGGLGHCALQWAAAMGAEVTALSRSASKEAECKKFGAKNFIVTSNAAEMAKHKNEFDVLMDTTSANLDYDAFLELVKPRGRFVLIGAPPEPFQCKLFPVILRNISICGSVVGSPADYTDMFELAVRKHVVCTVEVFPFSETNNAVAKTRLGQARYRCVLEVRKEEKPVVKA